MRSSDLKGQRTLMPLVAAIALLASANAVAAPTVAVPSVQGPKKSGAEKIEKQLRQRLAQEGLQVVSERALASAARKANGDPASAAVAQQAGADLLLVVTVKKSGKKYIVEGKLIDVVGGTVVRTSKESYKKGGAAAAGAALGGDLVEAALSFKPPDSGASEDDRPAAPQKRAKVVSAKEDEDEPRLSGSRAATPAASVTPKDEDKANVASTSVSPTGAEVVSGDLKVLQLGLGIGTQMASAYTVTVGGQATGLAYNLNPLVCIAGRARLMLPDIGLGAELDLSFVPVKYTIDVSPAVTPNTPGGHFLNVGVTGFYELTVARFGKSEDSRFFIAPLAGLSYNSLAVAAQTPYAVVVSSSAVSPTLGGRVGLQLAALTLEANVKASIIVSYSESPQNTGTGGGGFGLYTGAALRYWISSTLGVSFAIGYDFMRIGLSGMGSRAPFANDPALNNATVFSGNVKAIGGVALAI
jgi:hypothetical protein